MKKKFLNLAMGVAVIAMAAACNSANKDANKTDSSTMSSTMSDTSMKDTSMMASNNEKGVEVGGAMMLPSKNIVENAMNSKDHTTLVAAIKEAGLVETLSGPGPFTVFAPTNEAFDKIPKATLDNLMKPAMKADLTKILTYHVVPGTLKAADLKDGMELTTVQGEKLKVSVKDGKVMINGATVTIPDIMDSNGVTHVIDQVLMPK